MVDVAPLFPGCLVVSVGCLLDPFPEAVWLCVCGNMKKVSHHIAGYRQHPDERVKHMKARAESAVNEEEDNG